MSQPFDSGLGDYTQWVHSVCPHWTRNHSTKTCYAREEIKPRIEKQMQINPKYLAWIKLPMQTTKVLGPKTRKKF